MEIPKMTTQDYSLKLAKGLLGAIPFAGGFVGELLDICVIPQYQKKLEEWFIFVNKELNDLTVKNIITKDEIFNNEEFASLFQRTSKIYANNIQKHKEPLLKSFLLSSLTKPKTIDKKLLFLSIIDELTENQLMILKEIYDNEMSPNYMYQSELEDKLAEKYLQNEKNYLELVISQLANFRLLGSGSANIVINNVNQWNLKTSIIGKEFINYLTN